MQPPAPTISRLTPGGHSHTVTELASGPRLRETACSPPAGGGGDSGLPHATPRGVVGEGVQIGGDRRQRGRWQRMGKGVHSRSASTAMSSASLEAVELRVSSGGSPLLASLCTSLEGSSASTSGTTMLFIAAGRNLRTNEGAGDGGSKRRRAGERAGGQEEAGREGRLGHEHSRTAVGKCSRRADASEAQCAGPPAVSMRARTPVQAGKEAWPPHR